MESREILALDGTWRFSPDPHADGESLGFWKPDFSARLWGEIPVPGCFEAAGPSLERYTGMAWYRRTFRVPADWQDRRIVLHFEGVNYRAKVWLNGQPVGENSDGFLPFEWEIGKYLRGEGDNVLTVQVDNLHHDEDVPGKYVQWRGYGGILREVFLYATDTLFLERVRVKAVPAGKDGQVEILAELGGDLSSAETAVEAAIKDAAGKTVATLGPIRPGADGRVSLSGLVPGASLWSPASPALYTATVSLRDRSTVRDAATVRFGFRHIEVTPQGLRLNGQPVFLTGFDRHEDSPRTAMAVDKEIACQDFTRMKEAGANFVRLCHYPHHPGDLDLCDELGLMVMGEVPLNIIVDPARARAAERQVERMIRRDEHHPSVIFWSVGNETNDEDPATAEFNRALIRKARELDPTRLCMHVSHRWKTDPNFDEDDVICINYYPSIKWKDRPGCSPEMDLAQSVAKWRANLEALHAKYPSKLVLITEFGYVSLAGTQGHSFGEDLHARVIEREFAGLDMPYLCGTIIWCWADHPWPPPGLFEGMAISPFGVVGRDRRPKKPFWAARKMFRAKQGMVDSPAAKDKGTNIIMTRSRMDGIPDVPFPPGYGIRPMTLQDVGLWTDIERDAEPFIKIGDTLFMSEFGSDPAAVGRRCFIMTDSRGLGVGTISAWCNRDFRGEDYGRIHWLAVRPAHQGKGLARAALAYAMRVLAQQHERCYLVTSIQRANAVRLYLDFGFVPDLADPGAVALWRELAKELDHPALKQALV